MNEKKKIDLPCDIITADLVTIAQRLNFIESLLSDSDRDIFGPAVLDAVKEDGATCAGRVARYLQCFG